MKGMLQKWVMAQLRSDANKASPEDDAFLEECDYKKIVDEIPATELADELLSCRVDPKDYDPSSFRRSEHVSDKGAIIDFIEGYYGDMTNKLQEYFASIDPEKWSLDLVEMVSECDIRCEVFDDCEWRKDRAACIETFKRFVKVIESTDDRSDEFWRILFDVFTPAFLLFQEWDRQGVNFFMDGPCPEFMRGVVKMAKQGVTLDQFETYIKS